MGDIEFINMYMTRLKAVLDDLQGKLIIQEVKNEILQLRFDNLANELAQTKEQLRVALTPPPPSEPPKVEEIITAEQAITAPVAITADTELIPQPVVTTLDDFTYGPVEVKENA